MASTESSSYILLFPVLRTCVCMSSVPWKGESRAAFHCPSQIQMQPFRDATSTSKALHPTSSSGLWWNQWVSWLGEVLWRGDSSRVQTAAKTCNFVCTVKVSRAEAEVWVLLQSNCSHRTGGRPEAACLRWCGLSWRLSHPPRLWSLHPWGISPISDGKSWVCKL